MLPDEDTPGEGFADDLSATWDAMEAGEAPPLASETAEPIAEAPLRDELGRFAKRLREELGEEEPSPVSVTTAPEHWSQADRESFDALPEEMKPLYLEKAKLLESGWNRKFEEIAGERKTYESLNEIFGPGEMQQLADAGVSLPAYVGRLVSVGRQLEADPEGTIRFIAEQYGVDLGSDPYSQESEQVAALRSQVEGLQNYIAAQRHYGWQAFASEHGVTEPVMQAMGVYLSAHPQQPGETDAQAFRRAFEAVKWTDPGIREADARARDAERQRKADLAKAKSVGRVVKSKTMPGMNSPEPGETWRSELERQWDLVNA